MSAPASGGTTLGRVAAAGLDYEIRGAFKAFSGVPVLKDVSIDFHPGEVHTLVGENGAGKSTLLKLMSGVYTADRGEFILDGVDLGSPSPAEAQRKGIYLVPQEPRLMPDLSVAENLFLGALPVGRLGFTVDWKTINDSAGELLAAVGLNSNPRTLAGRLSLAHQQLLECARALAHGCGVIYFDEPTSPLSGHEAEKLFSLMNELRERGLTLGFISHRLDEVEAISDRITVLRDGEVVARADRGGMSRGELIRAMVGREISLTQRPTRNRVTEAATVLVVDGVESLPEVKRISLRVSSGEIVGLAGLVGSGRTELAESVFGLRGATAGRVTIDGRDISGATPSECIDAGLVYLAEDRGRNGIFSEVDLTRNATSAIVSRLSRRLGLLKRRSEQSDALAAAEELGVRAANMDLSIKSLSGGNQQKVLLARWVLAAPRAAIFDEPTRGVDVGAKEGIYEIIEKLAADGLASVVISSELEELVRLCDRVYVIYEGEVAGELAGDEITVDALGAFALGAA
ncbi:sugar ABC transporter ATP-binding protein [Parafrigoribacterium humi]|uniref:sugar ABC transporter ATP-binding protein n=1 Tax=Parafrigoribacterium humi TaxID=3144664 RepID=UPI0032EB1E86